MDTETVWVLTYTGLTEVFRGEEAALKAYENEYLSATSQGRVLPVLREAVLQ